MTAFKVLTKLKHNKHKSWIRGKQNKVLCSESGKGAILGEK